MDKAWTSSVSSKVLRSMAWPCIPLTAVALGLAVVTMGSAAQPTMGGNKGTVSGAAGGAQSEGQNGALENCGETLGTMALQEDVNAPWFAQLRGQQLGSTIPVLRLMI